MLRSVDQDSATDLSANLVWFVVVFCWIYSLLLYAVNCTRAFLLARSGRLRHFRAFLHVVTSVPLIACVSIGKPWNSDLEDSPARLILIVLPLILLVALVIQWRRLRQIQRIENPSLRGHF